MNSREVVLATLGDRFIQVHEYLLRALKGDGTTAIILSKLVSFYEHNERKGTLEDGWCPFNAQYIETTLGINEYHQRKSIELLAEKGLIKTEFKGYPKRRFVLLNFHGIADFLSSGTVRVVDSKPNPDKTSFYKALNEGMANPFPKALGVSGNIDRSLFSGMYVFSKVFFYLTGELFEWTPRLFGVFKNYWRGCYLEKDYDFSRFKDFEKEAEKKPEDPTIQDWINFDRMQSDKHHTETQSIEEYLDNKGDQ